MEDEVEIAMLDLFQIDLNKVFLHAAKKVMPPRSFLVPINVYTVYVQIALTT